MSNLNSYRKFSFLDDPNVPKFNDAIHLLTVAGNIYRLFGSVDICALTNHSFQDRLLK